MLACAFIVLGAALIYLRPGILLLWLIVGILLYSYNFVILLIPTTTVEKTKIKDRIDLEKLYDQFKEIAQHLIFRRRRLAIEVGLTIFFGGMVPLALSFSIIFAIGLVYAISFGFLSNTIGTQLAGDIVTQIILILLFYVLMLVLEPHAQGITRIAKSIRIRLKKAHSKNRVEFALLSIVVGVLLIVCAVLFFGAILLPGNTLLELLSTDDLPLAVAIPDLIAVLVTQLVIMRHFQGMSSRWMALSLLKARIGEMKSEVLEPLNRCINDDGKGPQDVFIADLGELKAKYCGLAIYDVAEQNFFGYGSIFLVAPRLRYALDDSVLACASRE
ncbi:MAG: hypothetical protein LUO85_02235 [Methanomassiliicoccales archaeon]|nr:hypothetical protein [Methanomassiliicoccales archaeon]